MPYADDYIERGRPFVLLGALGYPSQRPTLERSSGRLGLKPPRPRIPWALRCGSMILARSAHSSSSCGALDRSNIYSDTGVARQKPPPRCWGRDAGILPGLGRSYVQHHCAATGPTCGSRGRPSKTTQRRVKELSERLSTMLRSVLLQLLRRAPSPAVLISVPLWSLRCPAGNCPRWSSRWLSMSASGTARPRRR
jgi:hypothetical protein